MHQSFLRAARASKSPPRFCNFPIPPRSSQSLNRRHVRFSTTMIRSYLPHPLSRPHSSKEILLTLLQLPSRSSTPLLTPMLQALTYRSPLSPRPGPLPEKPKRRIPLPRAQPQLMEPLAPKPHHLNPPKTTTCAAVVDGQSAAWIFPKL